MPNHPPKNNTKNTISYVALVILSITFFLFSGVNIYADDGNLSYKKKRASGTKREVIIPKESVSSSTEKKKLSELQTYARQYRDQGLEQQNIGNLEAAMSLYQKAIELDPAYATVYNDLGIIYEANGDIDRAENIYQKALTIDPNYLSVYSNLALLYEGRGDFTQAILYWKQRAELGSSEDPWSQKAKARLYNLMRTTPGFEESFREQEVVELSKRVAEQKRIKKQEELEQAQRHLRLAEKSYGKGEYNKAMYELGLALSLNPEGKDASELKDKVKLKIIEQEKTAKEEKKKVNIRNMQAHFGIGIRYYQQDNLQQALEEFAKIETLVSSPQKK